MKNLIHTDLPGRTPTSSKVPVAASVHEGESLEVVVFHHDNRKARIIIDSLDGDARVTLLRPNLKPLTEWISKRTPKDRR